MRAVISRQDKYVDALLAMRGGSGGSGITQLTGDVLAGPGSGAQAATVVRINGATVPAAGALTAGTVLQVAGASALSYGALNLGSAVTFTGVLPNTKQQPQVMGGDVSGTTNAATVTGIQGVHVDSTAPTVNQQLVFNGAVWTPETVVGTNGVKAITEAPSAGGVTGAAPATVASANLAIGAGQTILVRGYVQLLTAASPEVTQTQDFIVSIVLDSGVIFGEEWAFDTPLSSSTWKNVIAIEKTFTGLSVANHTFAIQVVSLIPGQFTNASRMIVEQLIPSG